MAINIGSFVGPMIAPLLSGGTSDGVPNLLGYDKRSCGGNAVNIDICQGYCPGGCHLTPPTPEQFEQCCTGAQIGVNYWLVWGCWCLPMLFIAMGTFYVGAWKPGYIVTPPGGSYLGDFFRCVVGAMRCLDNGEPSDGKPLRRFERLKGMRGMPSGRIIDEFRMMLITSSIFVPFSMFWFCNSQMYTWGMSQCIDTMKIGGWMNCNQIQNMNALSILVTIPIFDNIIYPILRKFGIQVTHVQKISAGMVIMVSAEGQKGEEDDEAGSEDAGGGRGD